MKKSTKIVVTILGFMVFLVGISLLISSGYLSHILCDRQQFDFHEIYEFVRDETAQGIQAAGKWCAVLGGATVLFWMFKFKKEQ